MQQLNNKSHGNVLRFLPGQYPGSVRLPDETFSPDLDDLNSAQAKQLQDLVCDIVSLK